MPSCTTTAAAVSADVCVRFARITSRARIGDRYGFASLPSPASSSPLGDMCTVSAAAAVIVVLLLAAVGVVLYKKRKSENDSILSSLNGGKTTRGLSASNPRQHRRGNAGGDGDMYDEATVMESKVEGRVGADAGLVIPPVPELGAVESHEIAIGNLAQEIHAMSHDEYYAFAVEYANLEDGNEFSREAAKRDECRCKNRYANILAYDYTRVRLAQLPGDQFSDYVNANYVSGWQQPAAYIATQGPIPGTFTDFWRMVWEENCGVIVMVTKETEMGKRKCDKYWPDQGQPLQCGTLEVLYRDYDDSDESLCIRRMELRSSIFNESREVVQYQVKSWPDQGVPENGGQFLQLVHQVREETQAAMGRGQNGPVVTHCSAGIGRTGTFIAVDTTLRRLLAAGNIDLMSTVNHMRQERVGSVQTIAQYRFCYDAIQQYVAINGIQAPPTGASASDELSDAELNSLETLAGYDDGMTDAKLLEQLQLIINQ